MVISGLAPGCSVVADVDIVCSKDWKATGRCSYLSMVSLLNENETRKRETRRGGWRTKKKSGFGREDDTRPFMKPSETGTELSRDHITVNP